MAKTNTNKIKKFLSLALLLSIAFNQVSLCMQKTEETVKTEEKTSAQAFEKEVKESKEALKNTIALFEQEVKEAKYSGFEAVTRKLMKLKKNGMPTTEISQKNFIN